jgi:hypothetical protein
MALQDDRPAINKGGTTNASSFDQPGIQRDVLVDGAFEYKK